MKLKELFENLFSVLGDDIQDYFISGSLSFLPLLKYYRKPGNDIDVSIKYQVFRLSLIHI